MLNTTETKVKKSEACRNWVRGFNAIDQRIIDVLMEHDMESWTEVTLPAIGDRVYLYDWAESGEIVDIVKNDRDIEYFIELDTGEKVELSVDEFEVERDSYLPMWGTMWNFGDWWADDEWMSDKGITFLSECGFRIYRSEEYGYFFGIDGAGYDFYEAHWLPLYDAIGLKWHDVD